jgi:hypothetical protein
MGILKRTCLVLANFFTASFEPIGFDVAVWCFGVFAKARRAAGVTFLRGGSLTQAFFQVERGAVSAGGAEYLKRRQKAGLYRKNCAGIGQLRIPANLAVHAFQAVGRAGRYLAISMSRVHCGAGGPRAFP